MSKGRKNKTGNCYVKTGRKTKGVVSFGIKGKRKKKYTW